MDAIRTYNPKEESEKDCQDNYKAGKAFVDKLFQTGKIDKDQKKALMGLLGRLLDACIGSAEGP